MIAKVFEKLGHLPSLHNDEDLPNKIKVLKDFMPRERDVILAAVAERASLFLQQIK